MIFLLNNFNYVRFLLNYGKLPKEEAIIEVVAKIMHPVMKIQESIRYSGTKVVVLHSQYFLFFWKASQRGGYSTLSEGYQLAHLGGLF